MNNWLSANKILLNVEKTELVIFKSPSKVLLVEIKIKLSGKSFTGFKHKPSPIMRTILKVAEQFKQLDGVITTGFLRFLHCHDQVNSIVVQRNKANALLIKIRNYVNTRTLRNIYFAVFDSHSELLMYCWSKWE